MSIGTCTSPINLDRALCVCACVRACVHMSQVPYFYVYIAAIVDHEHTDMYRSADCDVSNSTASYKSIKDNIRVNVL